MNIPDILRDMWMAELPRTKQINGFEGVVTFVIPEKVQELLQEKYYLQDYPDIAIIRRWRLKWSGKSIERQTPKTRLSYSLAYYDRKNEKFQIVQNQIWKHVKRVLWSMPEYVTSDWELFTAQNI